MRHYLAAVSRQDAEDRLARLNDARLLHNGEAAPWNEHVRNLERAAGHPPARRVIKVTKDK